MKYLSCSYLLIYFSKLVLCKINLLQFYIILFLFCLLNRYVFFFPALGTIFSSTDTICTLQVTGNKFANYHYLLEDLEKISSIVVFV